MNSRESKQIINVEKIIIGFKKKKERERGKRKLHRIANGECRYRGL